MRILAFALSLLLLPLAGCDSTPLGNAGSAGAASSSGASGSPGSSGASGTSASPHGATVSFPSATQIVVNFPHSDLGGVSSGGTSGSGSASSSVGSTGSQGLPVAQCVPAQPSGVDTGVCGDGFRSSTEACDDGNTLPRDGCSPACEITPQLVRPRVPVLGEVTRINCGTVGAVGSFGEDRFATGGGTYTGSNVVSTDGVANAAPAEVYQSERVGNFSYTLGGLSPGIAYTLRLHFAEIWWNSEGYRVFNVVINGTPVLENFDIVRVAGGANKAVVREFSPIANGAGQIVVSFVTVTDNPKLSGLELIPPTGEETRQAPTAAEPIAQLNSGGDEAGSFSADQFFSGGNTAARDNPIATSGVENAAPQEVYQSERYGEFSYTLGGLTPATIYIVRLHFAEIYYLSAGSRVFNVAINGTPVLQNFDIYRVAGPNTAVVRDFRAGADEAGQIVVNFSSVVDNAKLSGLEVLKAVDETSPSLPGRSVGEGRHPLAAGCNAVAVAFSQRADDSSALYLSTFNSAGQAVSSVQVAEPKVSTPNPGVAVLPGDDFVVAWTDFDDDELGIQLRKVVAGVPQGKGIVANEDQTFSQSGSDIVFDGSNLVVAWVDSHDAANGPDLRYRVFTPELKPLTGDQVLAATGAVEDNVVLAARNGRWAAAWRAGAQGMETIEVQSGSSHWTVGPFAPGATDDRPDLIFLDDSHLAVAFTQGTDPESTGQANVPRLHAAVLDPSAPGATESFALAPTQTPYATQFARGQTQPNLVLASDHLLVAWRSDAMSGEPLGSEFWSRRLPFTISGDALTLDLSHPEVPLIQSEAQRTGDQGTLRMSGTTLWPSGGIASVWDDSSGSFGAKAGATDVVLQVDPDFKEFPDPTCTIDSLSTSPDSPVFRGTSVTASVLGHCVDGVLPNYRLAYAPTGTTSYSYLTEWGSEATALWSTASVPQGDYDLVAFIRPCTSTAGYEGIETKVLSVQEPVSATPIPILTTTVSSVYPGSSASNVTDGSLSSPWVTYGNSDNEGHDDTPWIQFTFGSVYTLGTLRVSNYNGDGHWRGAKDVEIFVSTDGTNFTSFGRQQFQLGSPTAADAAWQEIALNGVRASAVKLVIRTNYYGRTFHQGLSYEGAWANASITGLSEVRFYAALPIASTAVSSYYPWSPPWGPANLFDGSLSTFWMTHGNSDHEGTDDSPWIQCNFDHVYSVGTMQLSNYNTGEWMRGAKDVEVFVSTDGQAFTSLGFRQFLIGSPTAFGTWQTFDLGGVPARAVKLAIHTNYYGRTFYQGTSYDGSWANPSITGLSELLFTPRP